MGNWFPKKNRGFIVGLWATCNNFGNIAGIQVAALLLDVFEGRWEWLMVLSAGFAIGLGALIFFFLVPHPKDIGIYVEEMTENEVLISTATTKEVYDNVIRNSLASPEEVVQKVRLSQQFRRLSIPDTEVDKKISFIKAWMLPGVMLYSSAFFCTKMAVYILLLWLPTFLKESELKYND